MSNPTKGTAPNLTDIRRVVRARLPSPEFQAVLFGSRAAGAARQSSDWDIGVIGPSPLRGAAIERIREDLENLPTLHTFDVVDLYNVAPGFREHALKTGIELT